MSPGKTYKALLVWAESNLDPAKRSELSDLLDAHQDAMSGAVADSFVDLLETLEEELRRKAAPMRAGKQRDVLLGASLVLAQLVEKVHGELRAAAKAAGKAVDA